MIQLEDQITQLTTITIDNQSYLPFEAVTDTVAAFLFPNHTDQMDEVTYQQVVETAVMTCHALGYKHVELKSPNVPFSNMGRYWLMNPPDENMAETAVAPELITEAEETVLAEASRFCLSYGYIALCTMEVRKINGRFSPSIKCITSYEAARCGQTDIAMKT